MSGEFSAAVDEYHSALALWPGHEDCLYYLANCLIEVGDERGSLASLERMVAFQPQSSGGWMQIGRIRLPGGDQALDDLERARSAFEQSHALNSEESGPQLMLAVVQKLAGELGSADAGFAKAARLNPSSIEARWFGGRVAWLSGKRERALERLGKARALAEAGEGAGGSASNEGDTISGEALVSRRGVSLEPMLHRWRSVGTRPLDIDEE